MDRVVSVGRDREGGGVVRLKDEQGRTIALRLRRRQVRTLADSLSGLAQALEGDRKG